ncbi:MAG TPA: isochorismatase family protein [Caulobacteraceae bacterium]|nr:isochorismatase family protein [Caulobacteraceae bacterium]
MTAPSPANAPVIVVDLQTGMLDGVLEPPLHDAERLVENARAVIAWARRSGRPVAFVRHDGAPGDSLAPGKPGWAVWPALGQAADEPTFSKSVGDAFSNAALGDWIGGAAEVIVLGAQTDQCVAATVAGALARGLGVTVVADAHGTWDFGGESAAEIIARHNRDFAARGARVVATAALTAG